MGRDTPYRRPVPRPGKLLHSAPFNRKDGLLGRHNEAVACPEAGALGICVAGRRKIAAVFTWIEDMVGCSKIRREGTHWVFYEIRGLRPCRNSYCPIDQPERPDEAVP